MGCTRHLESDILQHLRSNDHELGLSPGTHALRIERNLIVKA